MITDLNNQMRLLRGSIAVINNLSSGRESNGGHKHRSTRRSSSRHRHKHNDNRGSPRFNKVKTTSPRRNTSHHHPAIRPINPKMNTPKSHRRRSKSPQMYHAATPPPSAPLPNGAFGDR